MQAILSGSHNPVNSTCPMSLRARVYRSRMSFKCASRYQELTMSWIIRSGEIDGKPSYIARTSVYCDGREYANGILPYPIVEGREGELSIAIFAVETTFISFTTMQWWSSPVPTVSERKTVLNMNYSHTLGLPRQCQSLPLSTSKVCSSRRKITSTAPKLPSANRVED